MNFCKLKRKNGNLHTPSSVSAHYKAQLTLQVDLSLLQLLSFSFRFHWELFHFLTLYTISHKYFLWFFFSFSEFCFILFLIYFCNLNSIFGLWFSEDVFQSLFQLSHLTPHVHNHPVLQSATEYKIPYNKKFTPAITVNKIIIHNWDPTSTG